MKKKDCLCCSCSIWIDCEWKSGKPFGFCLMQDLFTYTCKSTKECCIDYQQGNPVSEKEWEKENDPRTW